jgi:hypothetical protein
MALDSLDTASLYAIPVCTVRRLTSGLFMKQLGNSLYIIDM